MSFFEECWVSCSLSLPSRVRGGTDEWVIVRSAALNYAMVACGQVRLS